MQPFDDIRDDLAPVRAQVRGQPLFRRWLQVEPLGLDGYRLTGGPTIASDLPVTEEEAIERLEPILFPAGWSCVHCQNDTYRCRVDRPRVRICRRCKRSRSITSGTLLQRQRDLPRTFHATAWLLERVRSTAAFARAYGCNRKTAFATFRRLRQAVVRPPEPLQEPVVSALIGCITQQDQPIAAPPVSTRYGTVPAHRAPAVAWLGATRVVCFPNVPASLEGAPHILPPGTDPDPSAPKNCAPFGPHLRRGHQLACYLRSMVRVAHRHVSTRWVGRYLRLHGWMVRQRNEGASRWQQRDRLLRCVTQRPPCFIRHLWRAPTG